MKDNLISNLNKYANQQTRIKIKNKQKTHELLSLYLLIGFIISTFVLIYQNQYQNNEYKQHKNVQNDKLFLNRVLAIKSCGITIDCEVSMSDSQLKPGFTCKEIYEGMFVLYLFGMFYMFCALAIVCDDQFIPSIEVITEKLDISKDIAGATFMAAGGSMPELMTSFIAQFLVSKTKASLIGMGTIMGSAIFNVLFVIGCAAIFSKHTLILSWWPMARDVNFQALFLIILCLSLLGPDHKVEQYSCLILIICYIFYVSFMKFNIRVERYFKGMFGLQIEPIKEDKMVFTSNITPSIQTLRKLINIIPRLNEIATLSRQQIEPQQIFDEERKKSNDEIIKSLNIEMQNIFNSSLTINDKTFLDNLIKNNTNKNNLQWKRAIQLIIFTIREKKKIDKRKEKSDQKQIYDLLNMNEHLSTEEKEWRINYEIDKEKKSQTGGWFERIAYPNFSKEVNQCSRALQILRQIVLFPINFILCLTTPDVSKSQQKRLFFLGFCMSIAWIAVFSLFMVWWATIIGYSLNISEGIMGLTFLAVGTSIPDLLTSISASRDDEGDMAVSTSIGSNIFDITLGLPLPWIIGYSLNRYVAATDSMIFTILVLIAILFIFILIIKCFNWKMTKSMGVLMLITQIIFLTFVILIEQCKIVKF